MLLFCTAVVDRERAAQTESVREIALGRDET
jgi:hypothetical protein